jgi:hypothetical protein
MSEVELVLLWIGGSIGVVLLGWLIGAFLFLIPAQAHARGHGFMSWFIIQLLALNPLYPLVLVALLPNKARNRLREQYAAELDRKLATSTSHDEVQPGSANLQRSLGDAPTYVPVERSLGDQATRTS